MVSYKYAVKLKSNGEIYTLFVYAACIGNAIASAMDQVNDFNSIVISVFPCKE
jgi:hypothetical protein